MEEQQTPSAESKTDKKTTKKKIVVDEAKVREAKKKVNDLLQGTGLEDPTDIFIPPTNSDELNLSGGNENATTWLNEQVSALTQQVEALELQNKQLKNDNTSLRSGAPIDVSSADRVKITELYKYFEAIYTGRTPQKVAYDRAKFSNPQHRTGILDLFLSTFPFLIDQKQYQHRETPP